MLYRSPKIRTLKRGKLQNGMCEKYSFKNGKLRCIGGYCASNYYKGVPYCGGKYKP